MKNIPVEAIVVALLAVIGISLVLGLWGLSELERKTMPVSYEVGERIGFTVEGGSLAFGRLIPGSKSTRSLLLHNTHNFPVVAKITPAEDLEGLLLFNNTKHRILANQTINIPMTLIVPTTAEEGNYTSFVVVHIWK